MKNIRVININIGSPTTQQTMLRKESARLWNRLVKLHQHNKHHLKLGFKLPKKHVRLFN